MPKRSADAIKPKVEGGIDAAFDTDERAVATRRTPRFKVPKTKVIQAWFTEEEHAAVMAEAARRKEKVAPNLRRMILDRYAVAIDEQE